MSIEKKQFMEAKSKMTELERFPIEALVALVERETAMIRGEISTYGEHQTDPRTPALQELSRRFEKALEKNK